MAKAKAGAKKVSAAPKKAKPAKSGLLKSASKSMAKAAARLVKAVVSKPAGAKGGKEAKEAKPEAGTRAAPPPAAAPAAGKAKKGAAGKAAAEPKSARGGGAPSAAAMGLPVPEKARPRASKLPPVGEALTKRELEQLLTAGQGRGVVGEGSLKGRLVVKDGFPFLVVVGRDKRELTFLLQGPDQEVLPAYVDHKVSVSGLIRRTTNYGGTVDVRKYSAKKPEEDVAEGPAPVETEAKLRYLSPGEVEQVVSAGMGAGMKGFASIRGNLEMTGDDFILVVSNGGTRQQVSYLLEGKGIKGLRKHVGHTLVVQGVADKTSGWGGRLTVENFEPRPTEFRAVSRDAMEVVHVEGPDVEEPVTVRLNHGLTVRLEERPGFTWAIEPTMAKRVGLREANFEPKPGGAATREFFFTPRNPGAFEVEFFLAKALNPAQVSSSFKLQVNVAP